MFYIRGNLLGNEVLAFEGFFIVLLPLLCYPQYGSQGSPSIMIIIISLAIAGRLALVLVIAQGRFVYPIVGMGTDNPDSALTLVALVPGGMQLHSPGGIAAS